jgi:hypothetical protein
MLHEVDNPWGATISENNMLHEVDPPWGETIHVILTSLPMEDQLHVACYSH